MAGEEDVIPATPTDRLTQAGEHTVAASFRTAAIILAHVHDSDVGMGRMDTIDMLEGLESAGLLKDRENFGVLRLAALSVVSERADLEEGLLAQKQKTPPAS